MNVTDLYQYISGNWVDVAIIAVILFFFIEGWMDRFIPSFFNLVGFLVTYAIALGSYSQASKFFITQFSLPHGIANALGFFSMAILIEFVYNILISFIYDRIPDTIKDSSFNRYLGFVPAVGNGIILIAFIITLFITLPTAPQIKKEILDSKLGSQFVLRTQIAEQTINTVFGQAVNETLTFLTVHPNSSDNEKIDLKFQVTRTSVDTQSEGTMITLVNKERVANGLRPLVADSKLQELARSYGKDMFARGFFSHYNPEGESPFDRMQKAGITYQAAGENLAYAPNVDVAHTGLMNSPGHRANILSKDFGHVGIGVIDGGIYGKMFVQEFTN